MATSNATPWYKNTCITGALKTGALKVAIDSIGLIPEGGGAGTIARKIGNFNGYRGIVVDNFGKAAIKQIHGAKDTFNLTHGMGAGDLLDTGLAVVGFIPGLGQLAAGAEITVDVTKTGMEIARCQ